MKILSKKILNIAIMLGINIFIYATSTNFLSFSNTNIIVKATTSLDEEQVIEKLKEQLHNIFSDSKINIALEQINICFDNVFKNLENILDSSLVNADFKDELKKNSILLKKICDSIKSAKFEELINEFNFLNMVGNLGSSLVNAESKDELKKNPVLLRKICDSIKSANFEEVINEFNSLNMEGKGNGLDDSEKFKNSLLNFVRFYDNLNDETSMFCNNIKELIRYCETFINYYRICIKYHKTIVELYNVPFYNIDLKKYGVENDEDEEVYKNLVQNITDYLFYSLHICKYLLDVFKKLPGKDGINIFKQFLYQKPIESNGNSFLQSLKESEDYDLLFQPLENLEQGTDNNKDDKEKEMKESVLSVIKKFFIFEDTTKGSENIDNISHNTFQLKNTESELDNISGRTFQPEKVESEMYENNLNKNKNLENSLENSALNSTYESSSYNGSEKTTIEEETKEEEGWISWFLKTLEKTVDEEYKKFIDWNELVFEF